MAANNDVERALRFRNGLPAKVNLDDKLAFASHRLEDYYIYQWSGNDLSKYFADQFQSISGQF